MHVRAALYLCQKCLKPVKKCVGLGYDEGGNIPTQYFRFNIRTSTLNIRMFQRSFQHSLCQIQHYFFQIQHSSLNFRTFLIPHSTLLAYHSRVVRCIPGEVSRSVSHPRQGVCHWILRSSLSTGEVVVVVVEPMVGTFMVPTSLGALKI